jgi:flagellar biosynthesis protein FlhA
MELASVQNRLANLPIKQLLYRSDIIAALGMVSILMIMIIPLPTILLDIFLSK